MSWVKLYEISGKSHFGDDPTSRITYGAAICVEIAHADDHTMTYDVLWLCCWCILWDIISNSSCVSINKCPCCETPPLHLFLLNSAKHPNKLPNHQVPISRTDLSLLLGLNLIQSDRWLTLSLLVKLAAGANFTNRLKSVLGLKSNTKC